MTKTASALFLAALVLAVPTGLAAPAPAPAPVTAPAPAPQPAQTAPAGWTNAALASATYAVQEPVWEGGAALVSEEQRQGILRAMKNDSGQAIVRRYPAARLVEAGAAGAVRATPVIVAPNALLPWSTLGVRLDLELPGGAKVSLRENFGLLTLWQQGPEAANFAFNQLVRQLP